MPVKRYQMIFLHLLILDCTPSPPTLLLNVVILKLEIHFDILNKYKLLFL